MGVSRFIGLVAESIHQYGYPRGLEYAMNSDGVLERLARPGLSGRLLDALYEERLDQIKAEVAQTTLGGGGAGLSG